MKQINKIYLLIIGTVFIAFGSVINIVINIIANRLHFNAVKLISYQYNLLFFSLGILFIVAYFFFQPKPLIFFKQTLDKFKKNKYQSYYFWLFIVVIIFIIYYPTINNFFVYEDYEYLIRARNINLSNLPELFSLRNDSFIYFPLMLIKLRLNYEVYGLNPVYYHIEGILEFVLYIFLTGLLLKYFFTSKLIIYGVLILTTINATVFQYIDHIATCKILMMFPLIPIICFLEFRKSNKTIWYFLSLISLIIGVFWSPWVITVPPIILLYDILFSKPFITNWKKDLLRFHMLYWIIILLFVISKRFIGGPIGHDNPVYELNIGFNILRNSLIYFLFATNIPFAGWASALNTFSYFSTLIVIIFLGLNVIFIIHLIKMRDIEIRNRLIFFYLWFPLCILPLLLIKTEGHLSEYSLIKSIVGLYVIILLLLFKDKKISPHIPNMMKFLILGSLVLFSLHWLYNERRFNPKVVSSVGTKLVYEQFNLIKPSLDLSDKQLYVFSNEYLVSKKLYEDYSASGRIFMLYSHVETVIFLYMNDSKIYYNTWPERPNIDLNNQFILDEILNSNIIFWNNDKFKKINYSELIAFKYIE